MEITRENNVSINGIRDHEDTSNYYVVCQFCGAVFSNSSAIFSHYNACHLLKRDAKHKRIESLHQCNECNLTFMDKSHLNDHVTSIHPSANHFVIEPIKHEVETIEEDDDTSKCHLCGFKSQHEDILNYHISVAHAEMTFKSSPSYSSGRQKTSAQ